MHRGRQVFFGPAGPHAVTTAGANTYTYDGNGNMTAGAGRTITWTSSNLPALIRDTPSGNETAFTYGPGRERIEQRILRGGLTSTVTYIDSVYEKRARLSEADELVHYIRAGATVAIYTKVDDGLPATDKTRYLHKDHLGSIEAISDEAGVVTERLSYDPHGKRRQADWQPGVPVGAGAETPRGFTGHEMLDGVALIHMNGRVYDPVLGRYISADPIIQYPDTTQGFNRYTYVNNNPLSYTDPSGFGFFSKVAGFFKRAGGYFSRFAKGILSVPALRIGLAIAAVAIIGPAVAGLVSNAVIVGGAASATAIEAAVAAATVVGNTIGGVVAGAAGSLIGSGGDLQSAGIGALTGGLFGFVGASSAFGSVTEFSASRIVAHGVIGGIGARLSGEKFGPAAFASAFAKFATPFSAKFGGFGGALASAVIGGTASRIGGGKFQNGAVTAAFGYLLNHCAAGTSPECGGTSGSDHDHINGTIGPLDFIGGGISGLARGIYGLLVTSFSRTTINITARGLAHTTARHTIGGTSTAGRSVFAAGEDVATLVNNANGVARAQQVGGNFQRILDAGRTIGIDRATGQPTSTYTVITNAADDLITTFPELP